MDSARIDLLLRYILLVAGEEERGERELGPIHLVKYAYLGDLAYAEIHNGKTFTGAPWRFHHFGPWAEEVYRQIEPTMMDLGAERKVISSSRYDDSVRYTFSNERVLERLENEIPTEAARAIKFAVHRFGQDTSELLHYVYTTPPMLRAAPGEVLVFAEVPEEQPHETGAELVSARAGAAVAKSKTRRKRELQALRERVRERLSKARERRKKATPAPRYDEVFLKGVKWLDELAGPEVQTLQQGEAVFAPEIWKSRGRREPGIP